MPKINQNTEIIVACDAGMGSSAIGASMLKRQLQAAQIPLPVRYESIYRVTDQDNILLVTQKELAALAQKQAPSAQHFHVGNFLNSRGRKRDLFLNQLLLPDPLVPFS